MVAVAEKRNLVERFPNMFLHMRSPKGGGMYTVRVTRHEEETLQNSLQLRDIRRCNNLEVKKWRCRYTRRWEQGLYPTTRMRVV